MIFLKNIYANIIFFVYSLFPTNMMLPLCQKSKDDLLSKNTLKDDISGIIKKYDIHPRKYCISSDRKIKDHEKVYSVKNAREKCK